MKVEKKVDVIPHTVQRQNATARVALFGNRKNVSEERRPDIRMQKRTAIIHRRDAVKDIAYGGVAHIQPRWGGGWMSRKR